MSNVRELKIMQQRQSASKASKGRKLIEHSWSEVDDLYTVVATSLVDIAISINSAIQQINSLGYVDNQELIVAINGVKRDLESFTSELQHIKAGHENHSGIIRGEDELALCLSIFNDYTVLSDRFRAVVFPTMLTITEHLADAIGAIRNTEPVTIDGVAEVIVEDSPIEDTTTSITEEQPVKDI